MADDGLALLVDGHLARLQHDTAGILTEGQVQRALGIPDQRRRQRAAPADRRLHQFARCHLEAPRVEAKRHIQAIDPHSAVVNGRADVDAAPTDKEIRHLEHDTVVVRRQAVETQFHACFVRIEAKSGLTVEEPQGKHLDFVVAFACVVVELFDDPGQAKRLLKNATRLQAYSCGSLQLHPQGFQGESQSELDLALNPGRLDP
ncbi:hypothetical protein D3C75_637520 [compost metagenome]